MKEGRVRTEVPACRACHATAATPRARLDGYAVYRCASCGLVYSDLPDERIPELYDEDYYREEFGPYFSALFGESDDALLRERFGHYLDVLDAHVPAGRIVDVGCAAGLFLDVARARGWDVHGVEISEYAASIARERHDLAVETGDVTDVALEPGSFDVVAMLDMLEHAPDPVAALRHVRPLIAPGGALLLVLPNDRNLVTWVAMLAYRLSGGRLRRPAEGVHQVYHLSYFTPATIRRVLESARFEVLQIEPDETVQALLNEGPVVRLGIRFLFALARVLGLQNKMVVVARPTS
jgi:2-polyprenyl-3-methyl-5-hydroxy-6-metoxy-1,4-benzoquinol methylase